MSHSGKRSLLHRERIADLRGLAQLAVHATRGITAVSEGVHQSVWRTLGAPAGDEPGRTRGLTGMIYRSIHGVTGLVGRGVDSALSAVQERLDPADDTSPEWTQRAALRSVLNGVLGDHLVASDNPLAIPMTLRHAQRHLDPSAPATLLTRASGRILLMIHGLCMNDLHWRGEHNGAPVDHGEALAAALGGTLVHLRYNTGLHISQNGRALAAQLELLVAHWPVPVEHITIVAHSMGGLVARSACHYGEVASMRWRNLTREIVFLGTPHHGAPLERAGQWVDSVLARTMYTAPFAALGQMRSAGITDLRHGYLRDEDWQGVDRFESGADQRVHLPLPEGIACFSVVAALAAKRSASADHVVGDGLVPLRSALGSHDEPHRDLGLDRHAHWITHGTGHIELLHRPQVGERIRQWLVAD